MDWRASNIIDSKQYRLHLCQSPEQKRTASLVEVGSDQDLRPGNEVYLVTQLVPHALLRQRALIAISEQVPLLDGTPFFMDAHCCWWAAREVEDFDSNLSDEEIRWVTPAPPLRAPR
jgi:hypothetical protein